MDDKKQRQKISDNPSAKEIKALLPGLQAIGKAASFLGKLGVKSEKLLGLAGQIEDLVDQSQIFDLPDRFNTAFGPLGWIAVGSAMSVDVMKQALALHATGSIDEAEDVLVGWFNKENIELFAIQRARRFHQAGLRDDQLKEALSLYLEGRYMSAVPLVLIACDGFASDVAPVSPFEKDADLSCFDSITGHSTALPELVKLITKGVRKSRDDEIGMPLRHGILHGRSLGYANQKVCAKAWLLMMALVDWAIDKSSEEERRRKHEAKGRETLSDALDRYRQTLADKKAIDEFQPYYVKMPLAASLEIGSPEFAVAEFLSGWKSKNYGKMAQHTTNLTNKPLKKMAGELRVTTDLIELLDYEIRSIHRVNIARCDVQIWARAKTHSKEVDGDFNLVVFRSTVDGNVAMSSEAGHWSVPQNFMYTIMHEKFADADESHDPNP